MRVAFGDFVLDRGTRQLLCGGEERHVEPKALELLDLLLMRRPQAVSKSEIQRRLWPDAFVSESSLTGLVAQIRQALDDDARRPRFVRTAHGFGYAFCGDAGSLKESVALPAVDGALPRLVWGDRVLSLTAGDNLLGRDVEAAVCLDVAGVSRRHARIRIEGPRATLEDLASKNGTLVNGEPVSGPRDLRDGDAIRLGSAQLLFRSLPFGGPTATMGG
jgi:DNA-binding winged helix-turn-helix (wHTH) protein